MTFTSTLTAMAVATGLAVGMAHAGESIADPAGNPLRGIAQVNISAVDVKKARDWYARFLGVEPYFQRLDADNPAYVEFRLGDYQHELGIIDPFGNILGLMHSPQYLQTLITGTK